MENPRQFVLMAPEDTHWQQSAGEYTEESYRRTDRVIGDEEIDDSPVDLNMWIKKGRPDWWTS